MINISSKYIIILIFFTCLFVAFKKDKNIETLDCLISLNDLARNMYRQEVYKQLEKKGLNQEQMGVLYNDIFEAPIFMRAAIIEGTTPPAPNIKIFFFLTSYP